MDMGKIMEPGLYNMDCMKALAQFPDGFFDLAIVDPPYGGGATESPVNGKLSGGGRQLEHKGAGTLRRIV